MDTNSTPNVPPKPVKCAVIFLFASAGLRVVDWVVRDGPRHSLLDNFVYAGITAFTILLALVLLRRKTWARWLLLVITIAGLIGLPELFQRALARSAFSVVYFGLQSLLQISATILLFLRPSNDWFKGPKVAA